MQFTGHKNKMHSSTNCNIFLFVFSLVRFSNAFFSFHNRCRAIQLHPTHTHRRILPQTFPHNYSVFLCVCFFCVLSWHSCLHMNCIPNKLPKQLTTSQWWAATTGLCVVGSGWSLCPGFDPSPGIICSAIRAALGRTCQRLVYRNMCDRPWWRCDGRFRWWRRRLRSLTVAKRMWRTFPFHW